MGIKVVSRQHTYLSQQTMHHSLQILAATIWLVLMLGAVRDCLRSKNDHKIGWLVLIALVPFIGSILYFQNARGRFIGEL